jgi:Bacterial DNA-binding protein
MFLRLPTPIPRSLADLHSSLHIPFSGKFGWSGFGSLTVRDRAAMTGYDPNRREHRQLPATKFVTFKAARSFKEELKADSE